MNPIYPRTYLGPSYFVLRVWDVGIFLFNLLGIVHVLWKVILQFNERVLHYRKSFTKNLIQSSLNKLILGFNGCKNDFEFSISGSTVNFEFSISGSTVVYLFRMHIEERGNKYDGASVRSKLVKLSVPLQMFIN